MKLAKNVSVLDLDFDLDPQLDNINVIFVRKEEHEFYVDISPEFGFPLAIRPRFQLNAIIQRDPDVPIMR